MRLVDLSGAHFSPSFALLILSVPMLACESCGAADNEPAAPSSSRVTEVAAVDTSEFTRSERSLWLDLINDLASPCGGEQSVAECANAPGTCTQCVPAARYTARLLLDGRERAEIQSHFRHRYVDAALTMVTEELPVRGSPMAPVTIVEFSDFECPYCGRAHPVVQQLLAEFPGQVRVFFRHYPLAMHPNARPAARAAIAAQRQNKFWEMHDLLFEHQDELEAEHLERYATQLGLNMERFRTDVASPGVEAIIERDRDVGAQLELEGTPVFFVNGRQFEEAPSSLVAYVREELGQ